MPLAFRTNLAQFLLTMVQKSKIHKCQAVLGLINGGLPVAELTAEQFEQVPEFLKGEFELSGEVYVAKSELKAKALKQSLNDLDGKYKSASSRIAEIEAKEEENRTKAEQAALERLKKEGKVDEILADFEKRANETKAQYEARIEKLAGAIKADKRNLVLNDLASELKVFDDSKKLFSKLVQDRIDVDPESGKITYLDENGGATSLDKAGFLAELAKDSGFDRMRQAQPNTGGMANGSNSGGGASQVIKRADFDAMNPIQKAKFMQSGGKLKE